MSEATSKSTPMCRIRSASCARAASGHAAVGPQIGYLFPVGRMEGYINLKAYSEFAADNRPAGMNAWLTLVISPKTPEAETPRVGRPPLGR